MKMMMNRIQMITKQQMQILISRKKIFKILGRMKMLMIFLIQKKNKNLFTLKDYLNFFNNYLKDTIFSFNIFLDNRSLMELSPEDLLTLYFILPFYSLILLNLLTFILLMPVTKSWILLSNLSKGHAKKIKLLLLMPKLLTLRKTYSLSFKKKRISKDLDFILKMNSKS